MAKYRKVSTQIANDAKFRALSDHAKLLFYYLLTHSQMTPLGAMRTTLQGLAAELGWTQKGLRERFQELSQKGLAKGSDEAPMIWLPNFLKHNPPENPNVVKSWKGGADTLPECDLYFEMIQQVNEYVKGLPEGFQKGFRESFPEPFANGMRNQEQEQEQEQEGKEKQEKESSQPFAESSEPKPNGFDHKAHQGHQATRQRRDTARRILDFLNQKTGRRYQAVEANLSIIEARLKEGATEDQCRQVIVRKAREWQTDETMAKYLRPATLFNRTKFAQYQGEVAQ